MAENNLQANLEKIKEGGYAGVEMGAPATAAERHELKAMLADLDLIYIGQQWSDRFMDCRVEEHISHFTTQYLNNQEMGAVYINSHTGKDHFTLEDNLTIFRAAQALADKEGTRLLHEIHRGRATFSTGYLMLLLDAMPQLEITADFSHWCCVHESFLQDQSEAMARAIDHTGYIHARVGHTQASQIPDPRAPEWKQAVDAHLSWWDAIVEKHCKSGSESFYICPEFGPYPYMTHLPLGNVPISNLWDINLYMKKMLSERYQNI